MDESSARPSGLRPPSKLPLTAASTNNGLQEITDSQTNARSQYNTLNGPQKRPVPPPGSSLPATKRRPLAERAGSDFPARPPSSVSYVRPPSRSQGASLRELTQSTTSNSNTKIGALRQPVGVTHAASVGPGARPPSRSHTRTRSGTSTGTIRPPAAKSPRKDVQDNNVHDIDERVGRMDTDLRKVMEFMATTELSNHTFKEKVA
ncbi:hypothetical protein F5Y18DRAFT_363850 [Xylariaceae sp. FL1019]|nr:hypothetical protein F5Y18DRAFT_363850 [Xylariaceae sp. FL1019]